MRRGRKVSAVVAGIALAGLLAGPAQAASAHSPNSSGSHSSTGERGSDDSGHHATSSVRTVRFMASGSVTAVDTTASTITIGRSVSDGTPTTSTFTVSATAKIVVDRNTSATLADVPVGAAVVVSGNSVSGTKTALRVVARTTVDAKKKYTS